MIVEQTIEGLLKVFVNGGVECIEDGVAVVVESVDEIPNLDAAIGEHLREGKSEWKAEG